MVDDLVNPSWDKKFTVDVSHRAESLTSSIRDKDKIGYDTLGSLLTPVNDIQTGKAIAGWFLPVSGEEIGEHGQLNLAVEFISREA